MVEKQGSNAVKWLKYRLVPIFLSFTIIFYILYSTVDIKTIDFNGVITVSIRIAVTFIFGLTITSLTAEGGYTAGREDEDYISTRTEAVKLSNQILPYKKEAEEYVSNEIDKKIKLNREAMLKNMGILYDQAFDESGKCIFDYKARNEDGKRKYTRKQKRCVRKACRIVKKPFNLLAYSETDALGLEEAPSESKRRAKKSSTLIATRTIMAIVSGTLVFVWQGWTLESFIYTMAQLFIWLGSGIIERLSNYNFIVVTVRDYDKSRIGYMKAFLALKGEVNE